MPAHDLYPRFLTHLRQSAMLPSSAQILLACSGGLDSTVLLHLLHRLAARMQWRLVVGHINYGQRGAASEADEVAVRQMAADWGLPIRVDGGFAASAQDGNFQDRARAYRYRRFGEWMVAEALDTLCTAHHRDDQVETVLHHLLRGAGTKGLSGMAAVASLPVLEPNAAIPGAYRLVRPLLPFARSELDTYARAHALPWREDASNQSPRYLRNRIRHELVPLLRDMAPRIDERLVDLAALSQELEVHLVSEAELFFKTQCHITKEKDETLASNELKNKEKIYFDRQPFLARSPAVQGAVLAYVLRRAFPGTFFSRETLDKLSRLIIEGQAHAFYTLPGGGVFEKDARAVTIVFPT